MTTIDKLCAAFQHDFTTREAQEALGHGYEQTLECLNLAVRMGQLERVRLGVWRIVE